MILTQLQTYTLPTSLKRVIKHNTLSAKAHLQKITKTKIRRARSAAISAIRRQYYFNQAYADMRLAVSRNEDIFISSLMITAVLAYAATVSIGQFLIMFFNTAYGISEIIGVNIVAMMLTACAILGVLYLWVAAFTTNMMSISIMQGANRKKLRTLRSTARQSLRLASRVAGAWTVLLMIIALPIMLSTAAGTLLIKSHGIASDSLIELIPRAVAAAVAWVFIVLMNFGLAGQVALFEAELSLPKVFKRSWQLVKARGRIFLLLGYSGIAISAAIGFKLSVLIEKVLLLNKWLAFSLILLAIAMFANAMMVILYRKRRLARNK